MMREVREKSITIRVGEETYNKLRKVSREEGVFMKFYVDKAVDYYYNRKEK